MSVFLKSVILRGGLIKPTKTIHSSEVKGLLKIFVSSTLEKEIHQKKIKQYTSNTQVLHECLSFNYISKAIKAWEEKICLQGHSFSLGQQWSLSYCPEAI